MPGQTVYRASNWVTRNKKDNKQSAKCLFQDASVLVGQAYLWL